MIVPSRLLLPALTGLALVACGDLFGPDFGPPAEIQRMSGDHQVATVGQRLTDTLVVKVLDAERRAVERAVVTWSRVGDTGTVSPGSDTTGADGVARTVWTLGTGAGEQAVEAVAGEVAARFTATAEPGSPSAVRKEQGDEQEAAVTASLGESLVIRVVDRYDNPVPEVPVAWSVTTGGGTLDVRDPVTDADGRSEALWTLGPASGSQQASARVGDRLVTFSATGIAGPPAGLVLVSGDGQGAPAGDTLPDTLRVRLHDAHDNPVQGFRATWAVTTGGGTLSVQDSVTGENGVARAVWTLGADADTQHVEVTVADWVVEFTAEIAPCNVAGPDTDGDRLADCAETGTGVFVAPWDAGTDPNVVDTDGDGIPDGDEVLGTAGGLDLPSLGVSPVRRDLLLEYDWFIDDNDCSVHSHRPTASIVQAVTRMFADAPGENPDGTTGIHLIHDYGQGGVFTGGNLIDDADGVLSGGVFGSEYVDYKSEHFAPERQDYFHYVVLPHRYNQTSKSSGQAVIRGMDLIVSLQCHVDNTSAVANTLAHELGHNLGLLHGGSEGVNWKPNYNSVMNYLFQFPGVDTNCISGGDRVLDYSDGSRPPLDENDLDERTGVCGDPAGPAWDWNGDGDASQIGVQADINVDREGVGDGSHTVLEDYDDWANLFFFGPAAGQEPLLMGIPEVTTCMDVPPRLEIR